MAILTNAVLTNGKTPKDSKLFFLNLNLKNMR